ncbi:transglutaminase domain-containing protein [Streptomyces sp. MB09-01]|uniref:transglutaminase domain-containing protein n=1 Tax=Streptomyces sp. MB09-01 TaxID=3028666 RepID=UPI0029B3C388|nr:transglutaminase domain-containing protein [Streptomyces sp. MB09-01]MDX3536748.1 transglutaminase domain-containing protein [Streptomyces sp. MB09-01]
MHSLDPVPLTADAPVSFESLLASLDRFHTTPVSVARYDTDVQAAAALLRTPPEHVVKLTEHGLPFRVDAKRGLLFERADLMNVGLMSASERTTLEMALRFALAFSTGPSSEWLDPRDWLVTVRLPEGEPGRYRLRVPDFDAPGVSVLPSTGLDLPPQGAQFDARGHQAALRITGAHGQVRDRRACDIFREMLADLHARTVVYQCVAEPLRMNHHQAWEQGTADCIVVSRVITDRLRAAGLRARARRGYLLGVVGGEHAWSEVFEDGCWKPIDVGLAFIPRRFPGGQDFPDTRDFIAACFGSRLNRLLPCTGKDAESLVHDTVDREPRAMFGLVSATPWKAR